MMALLVVVMSHLGMDHPPFPSGDPIVPPPSQLHNTGYDVAGASGTRPGDTNDDDEEIETESVSSKE